MLSHPFQGACPKGGDLHQSQQRGEGGGQILLMCSTSGDTTTSRPG